MNTKPWRTARFPRPVELIGVDGAVFGRLGASTTVSEEVSAAISRLAERGAEVWALNLKPYKFHSKTLNPNPQALHPEPYALNPKPQTLNDTP